MMTLGEYLKKVREERGLTLQQVGDAIGISKGHLHGIESGRYVDIRLATAAALSAVLAIDVQHLANLSLQAHNHLARVRPEASETPRDES
jgi:transcriptional regulator with XRE-family HTH domain